MVSNNNDFLSFKKIEKHFQKNIKFGLQAYFNMEIILNSWIGILNSKMRDMTRNTKDILYFTTHHSITSITIIIMDVRIIVGTIIIIISSSSSSLPLLFSSSSSFSLFSSSLLLVSLALLL
jgi:hypothetical protein